MFTLARCRDRGAYKAKLEKPRRLSLDKLKQKYEIIVDTPIVVVIRVKGFEVIAHSHGELIFKNDGNGMEEAAREIYETAL